MAAELHVRKAGSQYRPAEPGDYISTLQGINYVAIERLLDRREQYYRERSRQIETSPVGYL